MTLWRLLLNLILLLYLYDSAQTQKVYEVYSPDRLYCQSTICLPSMFLILRNDAPESPRHDKLYLECTLALQTEVSLDDHLRICAGAY